MKLNLALLGSVLTSCSNAQYFSEGWKPGQPAHTQDTSAAAAPSAGWIPGQQQDPLQPHTNAPDATPEVASAASPFTNFDWDLSKLLVHTLNKLGMNITLPTNSGYDKWDPRIPLITDTNYEDLIVNEEFANDEEAAERTWILCITSAASNRAEAVSTLLDSMFDTAFNTTQHLSDLPHVRWGRIDYFNVTYLTTKWNVWQAPYLVVLKDRGTSLRFYRSTQIRVKDDLLREFLAEKAYESHPIWTGLYAPGGEREWLMDLFAVYMAKFYNIFTKIPKIILYVASGGLGSMLLSFMHKPSKEQLRQAAEKEKRERDKQVKEAEARKVQAEGVLGHAEKEVEKAKTILAASPIASPAKTPSIQQRPQSPSSKMKGKKKPSSARSLAESSTEGSSSSPVKTRSSTRQKKVKKATQ